MIDRRTFMIASTALAATPVLAETTAHAFSFKDIDGGTLNLADYAGKPLMVVNTASRCGFTYQYDGLQALYDKYRDRGFTVLTVPSDDFGGQELDTEAEVKEFCAVNFNLDMPMTSITNVRGRDAHPFYKWALEVMGPRSAPGWNFHKYLIGPDGRLMQAFSTNVEPDAPQVTRAVEALLSGTSS